MMSTGRVRKPKGEALVGTALLALVLWGCEGSHLFAPVTVGPQITDLDSPASARSGESITVAVRALGLVRIDSIVTTVRVGTFELSQVARQVGVLSDFSAAFDFDIPAVVSDTLGTIEAFAVDAQANVGPISAVILRTIDTAAPTVSVSLESPRIGIGVEIGVAITAEDNVALSQVGFRILDLAGDQIAEHLVEESGETIQRVLTYLVPAGLGLGDVQVVGVAVDHAGNVGTGAPLFAVLSDVDLPDLEILSPLVGAQEPAQMPLFVEVQLRDNDAVDSVRIDGVSHRGDATLGTDVVVQRFSSLLIRFDPAVADTILQRNLIPAADSTSENAFIRIAAYDREGNVRRDSVQVSLLADELPPDVRITAPLDGASRAIGDSILVETFIAKLAAPFRTGITTLRLEGVAFRGDPELGTFQAVPRFLTRTVTLDPPVLTGQVITRYLIPTPELTEEPVHIIATATDEWGNQGADTVRIDLAPDTLAPSVAILFPLAASAWAAGDSLLVQATGTEPAGEPNQRGVAAMTVDGVAYRPAQVLKYVERRVDFSPPSSQVLLNVWVQPTGDLTVEPVWIRVTAEDGAGNTTTDSVMVTLTPPPPSPPPPSPPQLGLRPTDQGPAGGPSPYRSSALRAWTAQAVWVRTRLPGGTGDGSARRRGIHGTRTRPQPGFFVPRQERPNGAHLVSDRR